MEFYCPKHPEYTEVHEEFKRSMSGAFHTIDGKPISCPECHTYLESDEAEPARVNIARFNNLSREDKRKMLKKRSREDNKKNEEVRRGMDLSHLQ